MGLFSWIGCLFSGTARYNRDLYRTGRANKNEVRQTVIGWRPDYQNGDDGFVPDSGNFRKGSGSKEFDTASGSLEYYRVIRGGKKTREQLEEDLFREYGDMVTPRNAEQAARFGEIAKGKRK